MKSYKRSDQVAELMQRELAIIIQRKKDNLLFTGVTITCLRMSPDLSHAKVFITILDETKISETLAALNKAAKFLQCLLFKQVSIRGVPKLHFVYDESITRGRKLSALIDKAVASDNHHHANDNSGSKEK